MSRQGRHGSPVGLLAGRATHRFAPLRRRVSLPPGVDVVIPGRVEVRRVARRRMLTVIATEPSPRGQRRRNLGLLVDCLDWAGVPYFLVPGFSERRYRIGVVDDHRERVCLALATTYPREPVHIARVTPDGRTILGVRLAGALYHDDLSPPRGGVQSTGGWDTWRVFEAVQTPDGSLTVGPGYGADLEFWTDVDGEWVAPRRNRVTPSLTASRRKPATVVIGGRSYQTFLPLLARKPGFDMAYTQGGVAAPEESPG